MEIIFSTGNLHKVEEAREILSPLGIKIVHQNLGYPELQADTLEEIAKTGAEWSAEKIGKPVMVDDSGLFIPALGGFPGPYSAYVHKCIGNLGILKLLEGIEERKAYFECAIGFAKPGEEGRVFLGRVEGVIAWEVRGSRGFGYDPIFQLGEKTLAEMTPAEKNQVSHRHNALVTFATWLKKNV